MLAIFGRNAGLNKSTGMTADHHVATFPLPTGITLSRPVDIRPVADSRTVLHHRNMKPNRFEWRDQERERVAREGTGARYVRHVYAQHLKRCAGMTLATIPIVFIIQALPQTTDGPVQPVAAIIAGVSLALCSIVTRLWLKPIGLMSNWALWTVFGMGCLMLLMGLLT